MKIFLVEDDAVIAAAIERHLAGWGYEVRCAGDFQHVMEAFDAFQPHLVLLDIPFLMATTGAGRFARSLRRRFCFSPPPRTI